PFTHLLLLWLAHCALQDSTGETFGGPIFYLLLWKRTTKVAVHPCPEHLGVQDATRGEGALGATRGHQEVQAEPGGARSGGAMDVHEPRRRGWCLCTPLLVLPPCRGETESPNAHPMPCQAAPP